jgi:hypothetical protein
LEGFVDTGINSVTIVIEGGRGSVELTQTQPAQSVGRRVGPRSGKDMLDAAVRDARAWLRANGRAAGGPA